MDATALAHFDVKSTSPGKEVAWIGPPGSERPAAVTRISASAAARNAGGETPAAAERTSAPVRPEESADGDGEALALALGGGGLLLGAAALVIALRRRPRAEADAW